MMLDNTPLKSTNDNNEHMDITIRESNPLIAVSRIYTRATKTLTLTERKTLIYALSMLRFTDPPDTCVIYISKNELAAYLGIHLDTHHLSVYLHDVIKDLSPHSFISFADQDRMIYDDGVLITRVTFETKYIRIKFEREYIDLFTNLGNNYITLLRDDLQNMSSTRSINLYEYLRTLSVPKKHNKCTCTYTLSIDTLKHILGVPNNGYGSYKKKDGHFDRNNFEKKCILPICRDIEKCIMIRLQKQSDDTYYIKTKTGYSFTWTCTFYPFAGGEKNQASPSKKYKKKTNTPPTWDINNDDSTQYDELIGLIENKHHS